MWLTKLTVSGHVFIFVYCYGLHLREKLLVLCFACLYILSKLTVSHNRVESVSCFCFILMLNQSRHRSYSNGHTAAEAERFNNVMMSLQLWTKSSATAEIARDKDETTIQDHSRSSVVVLIDAALYDFLLALNINLTSIFNRSWDITPSLHLSIAPVSCRWNWKRRLGLGGHALVSRCPEHWTIQT